MKKSYYHAGQAVELAIRQSCLNFEMVSSMLQISRAQLYALFYEENIKPDLLQKINRLLHTDIHHSPCSTSTPHREFSENTSFFKYKKTI